MATMQEGITISVPVIRQTVREFGTDVHTTIRIGNRVEIRAYGDFKARKAAKAMDSVWAVYLKPDLGDPERFQAMPGRYLAADLTKRKAIALAIRAEKRAMRTIQIV